MTPALYSTATVAKMLDCSASTVRSLCDSGKLRFMRFSDDGHDRENGESQ